MVIRRAFLLQEPEWKQLNSLSGAVQVLRPIKGEIAPAAVLLRSKDGTITRLRVGYDDVIFKFECFHVLVDAVSQPLSVDVAAVAAVENWTSIECLFQAEWERPASPSEVVAGKVHPVRQKGLPSEIPGDASAACISVAGILFVSHGEVACLLVRIDPDNDNPLSLEVVDGPMDMNAIEAEFVRVNTRDVQAWQSSITEREIWL